MTQTKSFRYAEVENCRAVELPYDGEELSMVILLPNEGSFETFESSLSESKVSQILANMNEINLSLSMPKFSFTSDFAMGETLEEMGMSDAFDSMTANFNAMIEINDLFIEEVFHKAFVSVNEKGTEAAAATAVMVARGGHEESLELNRPFIFFIRDIQTGAVVFLGRVMDPTKD